MARYYDNSSESQRFQPGTTVRADEVDAKFDSVASGFATIETEVDRSLKLVDDGSDHAVSASANDRRNRVVGFDKDGAMALLRGFSWRGDFSPGADYFVNDVFRDPVSKNLYIVDFRHIAQSSIDLSKASLAISVAEVEASKDAAKASENESQAWATLTTGQVDATDYSAKAYAIGGDGVDGQAGSAKDWAIKVDSTVNGVDYSAKYWATRENVGVVADNITDVNIVATDISSLNTTSQSIAHINTVAGQIGTGKSVTTVALDLNGENSIGVVSADISSVNTAANNIASVNTAAGDIQNISAVASNIDDLNTLAPHVGDGNDIAIVASEINNNNLQTVAGDIQRVIDVANDLNETSSDIGLVAASIGNVDIVGVNIGDANTVAANIVDVQSVANINEDVSVVAGVSADVESVSAVRDDVITVASNINDVTNFALVYYGPLASAPSTRFDGSPRELGDLYFNTTEQQLFLYDGDGWKAAAFKTGGTLVASNNLSDVSSAAISRSNLGLEAVASTGSYTDLSDKPFIPSKASDIGAATPDYATSQSMVMALVLG